MFTLFDDDTIMENFLYEVVTDAKAEGEARGRAEGKAEEAEANSIKTAINLFKMGLGLEDIAKALERNVSTVKGWLENRPAEA